jgi:nucleotide-binding universal stress UspA family protein
MEENPLDIPSSAPVVVPVPRPVTPLYRIFHPTDLSTSSEVAFVHALKLALAVRGELRIMHVDPDIPQTDWSGFPQVRNTLERWGLLPPGSSKSDVARLGLHIEKILAYHEEPTRSLEQHLKRHPADLLVLATHQPDVMERLISKAVAEPLARHVGIPTLFIPDDTNGFVNPHDGQVSLRNVLIPIGSAPAPTAAIEAATKLATALQQSSVAFTLLHVGPEDDVPAVDVVHQPGWIWQTTVQTGDVVNAITSASQTADLLVMVTDGHHGLLDALLGSTTEQVLRQIRCPLLAIAIADQA